MLLLGYSLIKLLIAFTLRGNALDLLFQRHIMNEPVHCVDWLVACPCHVIPNIPPILCMPTLFYLMSGQECLKCLFTVKCCNIRAFAGIQWLATLKEGRKVKWDQWPLKLSTSTPLVEGKYVATNAYLLIWFAATEAKDEQMSVGISAGKMLPISWELAVINSTVALSFDLETNNFIKLKDSMKNKNTTGGF